MRETKTSAPGGASRHDDFSRKSSLAFLVRDTGRIVARAFAVHIEPLGVNVSTWFMLRLLSENPGLSQREISRHLGILEPSAMETLVSMEQRGLITRDQSPEDRRKRVVALTDDGWALLDRIKPIARKINTAMEQCAAEPDIQAAKRVLHQLRSLLRKEYL